MNESDLPTFIDPELPSDCQKFKKWWQLMRRIFGGLAGVRSQSSEPVELQQSTDEERFTPMIRAENLFISAQDVTAVESMAINELNGLIKKLTSLSQSNNDSNKFSDLLSQQIPVHARQLLDRLNSVGHGHKQVVILAINEAIRQFARLPKYQDLQLSQFLWDVLEQPKTPQFKFSLHLGQYLESIQDSNLTAAAAINIKTLVAMSNQLKVSNYVESNITFDQASKPMTATQNQDHSLILRTLLVQQIIKRVLDNYDLQAADL